jgi:hypothetical protein
MSKTLQNEKVMYSLLDLYINFISPDGTKKGFKKFKETLVGINILEETVVEYKTRKRIYTALSPWFSEVVEGRYHVDGTGMRKGNKVNGTLYFDEYAIVMINEFYREALKEEVVKAYRVISRVALRCIGLLEKEVEENC